MRNTDNLFGLNGLEKYFVGFDTLADQVNKVNAELSKQGRNYPPYNIRKNDETTYTIEMAVAGFEKSGIEIEITDNELIIKGNASEEPAAEYLFKGLANRSFSKVFQLENVLEVADAKLANGILTVTLQRIVRDTKKSKKVPIMCHDYGVDSL